MPVAEITLREVYDVLLDVKSDVTEVKKDMETMVARSSDHETRIRGLERALWKASGVAAVLGTTGGYFATMFLP